MVKNSHETKRYGFNPRVAPEEQPTPVFFPGESLDRGTWQATVHRVAESYNPESLHN